MQNIKERQEFENYNKIKLLGEGSFGKAFLVERSSDKVSQELPYHHNHLPSTICTNDVFAGIVKVRNEANRHFEDGGNRAEGDCERGQDIGGAGTS